MDERKMVMHPNFADWYGVVSLDPQQVPLDRRWKGIKTFVAGTDMSSALDVVRLLFGKAKRPTGFDDGFRAAFKKHDKAFLTRGNDLEMELLAGATVAHLLDAGDGKLADAVALAVVCADFQGLREKPKLAEVVDLAYEYLHKRSDSLRAQLAAPTVEAPKLNLTISTASLEETAYTTPAAVMTAITPVLKEVSSIPNRVIKVVNDVFGTLTRQMQLQREESDMLWWLFAGQSRDLRTRMSDIGHPAASIIAGKELADLTLTLPGPVAAEALLDKMLQTTTTAVDRNHYDTSVREAVAADKTREWYGRLTSSDESDTLDDFCTVHFALRRAADAGAGGEWVPAFEKRAGVRADAPLSPVSLAMQVYRERLLIKAME